MAFETFPYTNFHELNLDWIIGKIKELSAEWLSFKNNADEWKNNQEKAFNDLIDYINNKWSEAGIYEEVTDVIQDMYNAGAFDDLINNMVAGIVSPEILTNYIGDYISLKPYGVGSFVKISNMIYTFNPTYNNNSNDGILRGFNLESNLEDISVTRTMEMGHANSACYDGTYVYIVPIWDMTDGTTQTADYIYRYNSSLTNFDKIPIPAPIMGVSYNEFTQEVYAYGYDHKIYQLEAGSFVEYAEVDFSGIPNSLFDSATYNQDFAVYENSFYISSPYGNILIGYMSEGAASITGYAYFPKYDTSKKWALGEIEGFEFYNGHLLCSSLLTLTQNSFNSFILELGVNKTVAFIPSRSFSAANYSYTVADSRTFHLSHVQLRSLNQFKFADPEANRVYIPANIECVELTDVFISRDVIIDIAGDLTLNGIFYIYAGTTAFSGTGAIKHLSSVNEIFRIIRVGNISFVGQSAITVSAPNVSAEEINLLVLGYDWPISRIRVLPVSAEDKPFKIGSYLLESYGTYIGSNKIVVE